MSSGVEAPGEIPPAARGDDDPALSEHNVSVGSERHASTGKSGPKTTTRMKLRVGTPGQAGEAVRGIEPDAGQSKIAGPAGLRVQGGAWGRGNDRDGRLHDGGDGDRDLRGERSDYERSLGRWSSLGSRMA